MAPKGCATGDDISGSPRHGRAGIGLLAPEVCPLVVAFLWDSVVISGASARTPATDSLRAQLKSLVILPPTCHEPESRAIQNIINRLASDKVPVHKLSHLKHRDDFLAVEYRQ